MYPVSAEYIQAVQDISRVWDIAIRIRLSNGTTLNINSNDIASGSVKYTEGATCGDTIQLGSTFSNSFEFRLLNIDNRYSQYNFQNAKVYPSIGLFLPSTKVFEYIPLGEFNILDNVKKLSTMSIESFDGMSLLSQYFRYNTLVFPMSALQMFDELVSQTGLEYTEELYTEIGALDCTISSPPNDTDYTCRDILSGLGLLLLKNLRFNRLGKLESYAYLDSGRTTDKNTRVGNSSYGDDCSSVTGVYLEDAYGNTYVAGTPERIIQLPSSPIIQGSEMSENILEQALSILQAVPTSTIEVLYSGDPAIQAGDILSHKDTPQGTVTSIALKCIYKFRGTGIINCTGLSSISDKQQTAEQRRFKQAFSRAQKDYNELSSKIDQTATSILLEVNKNAEDIASLQVTQGEVHVTATKKVGDDVKTLKTVIAGAGEGNDGEWSSTFTVNNEKKSGLNFDFDEGKFVFEGEIVGSKMTASEIEGGKITGTEMEASTIKGGEIIGSTLGSNQGRVKSKMDETGLQLFYVDEDGKSVPVGIYGNLASASGGSRLPMLWLGDKSDPDRMGLLLKLYPNGIWLGTDQQRDSMGNFTTKDNQDAGIFIDNTTGLVEIIRGMYSANTFEAVFS